MISIIRERQNHMLMENKKMAEVIKSTLRLKGVSVRDYRNGQGNLVTIWQEGENSGEVEAET